MLFVVGCEDEPVKVVKPKPKPSADDWIGTWEVELENGEPYNDSLDDRVRDIVERIVGDEDPLDEFSAEDVSLSTKVLFSNNGTYFVDNKFNFTMVYGGDAGLIFKLKFKIEDKVKGTYAISSYTYSFVDESSKTTLEITPKKVLWLDLEKMERNFYNDLNSRESGTWDDIGSGGKWSLKRGKLLLTETEDGGEVTKYTLKRI